MADASRNPGEPEAPTDYFGGLLVWLKRILVSTILVGAPVGFVYLFIELVVDPITKVADPTKLTVTNFVEKLPHQPFLYFLIAALLGARVWWGWYMSHQLREELAAYNLTADGDRLAERDRWVVKSLRERALALRVRADLILGFAFLSLLGGIYFVVFILPEVAVQDPSRILRAEIKNKFGKELDCISEGTCAFRITGALSTIGSLPGFREVDPRNELHTDITDEIRRQVFSPQEESTSAIAEFRLPRGEALQLAPVLSADGKVGVLGGSHGSVWVTNDGGENWRPASLRLRDTEWLTAAAFSADGKVGIVGGDRGSVMVTQDGGKSWSRPPSLRFTDREDLRVVALGADGEVGIVGGDRGSVMVTQDGGKSWSRPPSLRFTDREDLRVVALGADGEVGIVGGDRGSVMVTQDGGKSWSRPPSLRFTDREDLRVVALGADGEVGIVGGDRGSVMVTQDGGKSWEQPPLALSNSEWLNVGAFSAKGTVGVVGGDEGSVFVTNDGGESWSSPPSLRLREGEILKLAAFGADGKAGVVAGDADSVLITGDGGKTWGPLESKATEEGRILATRPSVDGKSFIIQRTRRFLFTPHGSSDSWRMVAELQPEEFLRIGTLSENGRVGIIGGDRGSIFMTDNGGTNWRKLDLGFSSQQRLVAAALSKDGMRIVVVGTRGALVSHDRGQNWNPLPKLSLKDREIVNAAAFVPNGEFGILGGNRGSVLITFDGGMKWSRQVLQLNEREEIRRIHFVHGESLKDQKDGPAGVIVTDDDSVYVVKQYPRMKKWGAWTIAQIRSAFVEDPLLKNSDMNRNISALLIDRTNGRTSATPEPGDGTLGIILNNLSIVRVATLAVTFFLVQVLIRLYQYSLRLASFWESRVDAMLVAHRFVGHKSVAFDELVASLAPDAYDFKPPPRSLLDWWRPQRAS